MLLPFLLPLCCQLANLCFTLAHLTSRHLSFNFTLVNFTTVHVTSLHMLHYAACRMLSLCLFVITVRTKGLYVKKYCKLKRPRLAFEILTAGPGGRFQWMELKHSSPDCLHLYVCDFYTCTYNLSDIYALRLLLLHLLLDTFWTQKKLKDWSVTYSAACHPLFIYRCPLSIRLLLAKCILLGRFSLRYGLIGWSEVLHFRIDIEEENQHTAERVWVCLTWSRASR